MIIGKGKKTSANSDEESSKSTTTPSLWPAGEYTILWDGFDEKGIYDSTLFNDTKLEAKITATKDGKQKSANLDFSTAYSQVQWTDVRIDKKPKRIDVTLGVNLTDGGTKGLSSWNNIKNDPPYTRYQPYDWDKIPASEIKPSQPIKKTRSRSFLDLEKLKSQLKIDAINCKQIFNLSI